MSAAASWRPLTARSSRALDHCIRAMVRAEAHLPPDQIAGGGALADSLVEEEGVYDALYTSRDPFPPHPLCERCEAAYRAAYDVTPGGVIVRGKLALRLDRSGPPGWRIVRAADGDCADCRAWPE